MVPSFTPAPEMAAMVRTAEAADEPFEASYHSAATGTVRAPNRVKTAFRQMIPDTFIRLFNGKGLRDESLLSK